MFTVDPFIPVTVTYLFMRNEQTIRARIARRTASGIKSRISSGITTASRIASRIEVG